MASKAAAKSYTVTPAADLAKVRDAAPELLAACEAMWTERFNLSGAGGEGTNYHSGWCGSDRHDPSPCKGTGRGISPCALWLLREAFKKAGVPKGGNDVKKS